MGLGIFTLNQSRADVPLAVVKVIVPGLRHYRHRLGPGRLFDVPLKMGWLEQVRTETELNPWALYF